MPELDSITGTGTLGSSTRLLGYGPEDEGTGYSVAQILEFGLPEISSIGTTSLTGSETLPLILGGNLYLATIDEIVAAGGGGGGGGVPVLPGVSVLDPYDMSSGTTLTNANLSMCSGCVRSSIPRIGGKLHFEVTLTEWTSGELFAFGLANAVANIGNPPGTDSNSFGFQSQYNQIFTDFADGPGFVGAPIQGDVYVVEVDFEDRVASFSKNGGSPIMSSAASPPGGWIFKQWLVIHLWSNSTGCVLTLNTGATSFVYAPSSGFSAWG